MRKVLNTNWRGYRIAAWIGQSFLGVAVLAAAVQGIGSLDDTIVDLIMDSLGAELAAAVSLWALQEWMHSNRHSSRVVEN